MSVFVRPAPGRRVRAENGRPIAAAGETVPLTTYYRRRIAAGDLVRAEPGDAALRAALRALTPGAAGQWTKAGLPALAHLSKVLNRRVTRLEVTRATTAMETT